MLSVLTRRMPLLACALVLSWAPASHAAAPSDFVGITSEDLLYATGQDRSSTMSQQHSVGVRLVRQVFDWSGIEKSPGHYDFALYDTFVRDAAAKEIGSEPAEGEVAAALPDNLVAGRKTDQMSESLDYDRISVADVGSDRLPHGDDLGTAQAISPRQASIMPSAVSISCSSIIRGGASRRELLPAPSNRRP